MSQVCSGIWLFVYLFCSSRDNRLGQLNRGRCICQSSPLMSVKRMSRISQTSFWLSYYGPIRFSFGRFNRRGVDVLFMTIVHYSTIGLTMPSLFISFVCFSLPFCFLLVRSIFMNSSYFLLSFFKCIFYDSLPHLLDFIFASLLFAFSSICNFLPLHIFSLSTMHYFFRIFLFPIIFLLPSLFRFFFPIPVFLFLPSTLASYSSPY